VTPELGDIELRDFEDSDSELLFDWMRDPVSVRMAAFTAEDSDDRERFDRWLARIRADPAIIHRSIWVSGAPVGMIATFSIDGEREITYWLDRAVWGRGIASRAVKAMLELDATRPMMARAATANAGSTAVLRRAGFDEVARNVDFAPGVGAEVEETIFRLDR
jgi:RimJ/RimL family protein N-acetyltransferase